MYCAGVIPHKSRSTKVLYMRAGIIAHEQSLTGGGVRLSRARTYAGGQPMRCLRRCSAHSFSHHSGNRSGITRSMRSAIEKDLVRPWQSCTGPVIIVLR